jgi:hypothetical protein
MSGLDYAALFVLAFLGGLLVGVLLFLGSWPGRAAAKRRHPYQSAVTIGGWVSLFGGGIFYPLVLIWAYAGSTDAEIQKLEDTA